MTIVKHPNQPDKFIDVKTGEVHSLQTRTEERTAERFLSEAGVPQDRVVQQRESPVGLTGVTSSGSLSTVFSNDYWKFTIWLEAGALIDALRGAGLDFGFEVTPGKIGRGYREVWDGLHHAQLQAKPINEGQVHCSLQLSGETLRSIAVEGQGKLLEQVKRWLGAGVRVKCTRADIAFDTKAFTVRDVREAAEAKLASGVWRSYKPEPEYNNKNELIEDKITFGSRESEGYCRIYWKKDGCSFGDGVSFTRAELELKGSRADLFLHLVLMENPSTWALGAAELLNGFMDIQADFWQEFKLTLREAWHLVGRKTATVVKSMRFVEKQVARSIAKVIAALDHVQAGSGRVWFEQKVLEPGRKKLTAQDDLAIRTNEAAGLPRFAVYGMGAL